MRVGRGRLNIWRDLIVNIITLKQDGPHLKKLCLTWVGSSVSVECAVLMNLPSSGNTDDR